VVKKAILYIGVAKASMAKGAGKGVTLTGWALAYLANG